MLEPNSIPPPPFPCGGPNQPACPPQPAIVIGGVEYWTREQIERAVHNGYAKCASDHAALGKE